MAEKILIIDDDVDTLRLVGLMLQRQGYQIVAANNGQQGLAMADAELPDLILLDVMMPNMDGYEVARRLRANPDTASIPILMFTAKTQLDDKVTGFEAGADDYLTKPTHPTELQAHVKALLARAGKSGHVNPPTGPTDQPAYNIGVIAARGGWGVTTVAINLASSLFSKTKTDVIVAEMRPGQGTIAFDFNIASPMGLQNLLTSQATDLTRHKVRENLVTLPIGLHLLLASYEPKDAILASTALQQFEIIASRLTFIGRYVVYDLGASLTAVAQKLLKSMNEIIVVAEPMSFSIIHTRTLLADLVQLGFDKRRISVVLNYRMRSDLQLSASQVMEKLGHSVSVTFTPAPELVMQASRGQTTAFFAQPDGLTGQQYVTLINQIMERVPKQAPPR
jgi:CheY-like chemotaxis protein/MinD-like ATPase involved in chromosome partitioning or flagellar assembly